MNNRAGSDFDSNHRFSGTSFGPNGFIASGSKCSVRVGTPDARSAACSSLPPSMNAVTSSSRDAILTYPPSGIAASWYSVSPNLFLSSAGPNPIENLGA